MNRCALLVLLCLSLSPVSSEDKLPDMPSQFETHIQASITHKNYTMSQTVYFDYDNNRGAVFTWRPGNDLQIELYDFEKYEMYLLTAATKTCETQDLRVQSQNTVWLHHDNVSSIGHILPASQWIKEMAPNVTFNLDSMDNEYVNGIRVDKWHSKITNNKKEYSVTHYFNSATFDMPGIKQKTQVPVQVDVKGQDFHDVYDYVRFLPGPIQDQSVFEIPRGYRCERKRTGTPPVLADQFSVKMEFLQAADKTINTVKFVYNFGQNISKMETVPLANSSNYKAYENKSIQVIHDFSSGIEYILSDLAADTMKCNMSVLPNTSYDVKQDKPDGHSAMKHGSELFGQDQVNYTWQGVREVRGIKCDVWSGVLINGDTTKIYERYTAQTNWTFANRDSKGSTVTGLWVGSRINTEATGEVQTEREIQAFDYSVHVSVNDFDIRPCYDSPDQMIHCTFKMTGSYSALVQKREHILGPAVRDAVSRITRIEPIRVTDVFFDPSSTNGVTVWITLLDKPPIQSNWLNRFPQVGKEQALSSLRNSIESGAFTVANIAVQKDSLQTDKQVPDPRQPAQQVTVNQGHSNSAMAGLGIGMLLIGVLVGLIGVYVWQWRQGRGNIPYHRNPQL